MNGDSIIVLQPGTVVSDQWFPNRTHHQSKYPVSRANHNTIRNESSDIIDDACTNVEMIIIRLYTGPIRVRDGLSIPCLPLPAASPRFDFILVKHC